MGPQKIYVPDVSVVYLTKPGYIPTIFFLQCINGHYRSQSIIQNMLVTDGHKFSSVIDCKALGVILRCLISY